MVESTKNTYSSMLKTIIRTSDWTQEQLAEKLGVSFATVNSWINQKSVPRERMRGKIQRLYLAQDCEGKNDALPDTHFISNDVLFERNIPRPKLTCTGSMERAMVCYAGPKDGIYVTILNADELWVGAIVRLEKMEGNEHDDEAIEAVLCDEGDVEYRDECEELGEYDDTSDGDEIATCEDMGRSRDVLFSRRMYVANSVNTVARGTYSAGRIYDKFDYEAFARVDFVVKGVAIAKVDLEGDALAK